MNEEKEIETALLVRFQAVLGDVGDVGDLANKRQVCGSCGEVGLQVDVVESYIGLGVREECW